MQNAITKLFQITLTLITLIAGSTVLAQGTPLAIELLPLGKDIGIGAGQTVTPAYEGWYKDDDGNIAISFGYYNRNTKQVLDIPVGAANRIIGAPGNVQNQGQPTVFEPGRHWGVFTVKIPADYKEQIVWHLENQGKTFHIPANLKPEYIVDAISGDASGNHPPEIRFDPEGNMGHGPEGITTGPLHAKVGQPLELDMWAKDDAIGSGMAEMFLAGDNKPPVTVTWVKQQGPGVVLFNTPTEKVPVAGGKASTDVTFGKAGDYLLRAQVNEFTGAETAGHAQCCWTNGFVKVSVTD